MFLPTETVFVLMQQRNDMHEASRYDTRLLEQRSILSWVYNPKMGRLYLDQPCYIEIPLFSITLFIYRSNFTIVLINRKLTLNAV